jgi:tRNA(Arg) A34 adenosine deaminase TadA
LAGRYGVDSTRSHAASEWLLFAHSGRLESTLSGHCVIAAADVVIRASGRFIGASWSVQFRWMQPLGNELRSGLQLSSNARTAHAERLIASRAARTYDLAFLDRCTLYTSAEPCATCAGAIYWTGIGRVVYGQSERRSKSRSARTRRIRPSICPAASCLPPVNADPSLGPLLEDEAARLQADF